MAYENQLGLERTDDLKVATAQAKTHQFLFESVLKNCGCLTGEIEQGEEGEEEVAGVR